MRIVRTASRSRLTLAVCKVGLDRPLIPTAFVANLVRSARVSRPRRSADRGSPGNAPMVGDWETCGRGGRAGQEALPEPVFEVPGSSRVAAADRSLEAPAAGRRDGTIRSRASYPTGKGASVVKGSVSTRRGSEESGTNAPFWPGACATRLQHAAPFRSWLQGRGVNLHRATAMKPWKTSSATNETRNAGSSFRIDPQWSGFGPVLPKETSRKPETGPTPRSRKNQV